MTSPLHAADFERVVFFTGAGISAESGVPTYRGAGGIWEQYNYEDYACQAAFDADPEAVWEFHNARRKFVASCEPNAGHEIIARLERERAGITVVTQNIDGLHQRAGSELVHELHGSLWRVRCDECDHALDNHDAPLTAIRHECGAYLRPDIVWFGDALRSEVMTAAAEAIASCDLLVSIGTSAVVFPAAQFPLIAKEQGATLVEINPEETALSDVFDHRLRGPASEMLPLIVSPARGSEQP